MNTKSEPAPLQQPRTFATLRGAFRVFRLKCPNCGGKKLEPVCQCCSNWRQMPHNVGKQPELHMVQSWARRFAKGHGNDSHKAGGSL